VRGAWFPVGLVAMAFLISLFCSERKKKEEKGPVKDSDNSKKQKVLALKNK
jgi:hypothetical protein